MNRKTVEIKITRNAARAQNPEALRDIDSWLEPDHDRAPRSAAPGRTPSVEAGRSKSFQGFAPIDYGLVQALTQARTPGELTAAQTAFWRAWIGVLLLGSGLFAQAAGDALTAAGRATMGAGPD